MKLTRNRTSSGVLTWSDRPVTLTGADLRLALGGSAERPVPGASVGLGGNGAIVLRRQPPVRITPRSGSRPRSTQPRRNRELPSSLGRDGRHRRQRPGPDRHAKSSAASGRSWKGRWPFAAEERYFARAGRSTPPRPSARTGRPQPGGPAGVRGATPGRGRSWPRGLTAA